MVASFLNRSCTFDARFDQYCSASPLKSFFNSIDPKATSAGVNRVLYGRAGATWCGSRPGWNLTSGTAARSGVCWSRWGISFPSSVGLRSGADPCVSATAAFNAMTSFGAAGAAKAHTRLTHEHRQSRFIKCRNIGPCAYIRVNPRDGGEPDLLSPFTQPPWDREEAPPALAAWRKGRAPWSTSGCGAPRA